MRDGSQSGRGWLLGVQSAFVLPLARGIFLLVALGCLIGVIGGTAYLVYLRASIASEPMEMPVPPPYQGSNPGVDRSKRVVDLAAIGTRLEAPANIRLSVTAGTITEPPKIGAVIGRFIADTPNSLAPFPDGVSLLGGRDAAFFDRVSDGHGQAVALAARPDLVAEIDAALSDIKQETNRTFQIRVVARDKYGITSAPVDLSFDLKLAPKPARTTETPAPQVQSEATELQRIAREIAQTIEPEVNPQHFSAYNAALVVPGRCGSSETDVSFLSNYRRALDEMRPRLTSANVEAFYTGLCDAWGAILEREQAELEHLRAEQAAARRQAEEVRYRAQAHNDELWGEHRAKVFAAEAQSAVTLSVIGGALAIFLSVALVLAFLAIEGHSRAVRTAMEAMVRLSQEAKASESAPEGP